MVTKFYKEEIEHLTIELTALKLFVKSSSTLLKNNCIIKKQLEDMTNIQETAN